MPGKRYLIEFVVALLAYGLLMTLALMALNNGWVQGGTRTVVAIAPMVACVGIWWAVVRHLRRSGRKRDGCNWSPSASPSPAPPC
ncbi:hypothetical protein [Nitrospirillum sp. BR 11163]|uniref:hypothetical protein n=1 Tax=Nitrospirillum sp. BR 11163 TaxID=3104323 RepID=UPI002AFE3BA9|nr:hypothetical protein [Nitrospirillum sp. BR 11163]MEA1674024.1 hypothetical protein [Nitrospirillum sp. BR 11163]